MGGLLGAQCSSGKPHKISPFLHFPIQFYLILLATRQLNARSEGRKCIFVILWEKAIL